MTKTYTVHDVIQAGYTLAPMVRLFCGSHEVEYNQYIGDAHCASCGAWQLEEEELRKENDTEDKGQPGICKLCGHNLDDSWEANYIDTDADMYVREYRCRHCGAIGEERHSLCFEENTARRLLQLAS